MNALPYGPRPRSLGVRWLVLLLIPSVVAQPLLVGVAPDVPDGEAIAVASDMPWDMTGWRLTDGEEDWQFPDGFVLEGPQWFVAGNGWQERGGPVGDRVAWGIRLGNDGDDVRLIDPTGAVVDEVLYGDKTTDAWGKLTASRFQVLWRQGVDTDTAADWIGPRPHKLGQSDWPAMHSSADAVTAYVAPDAIHGVLQELIEEAQERLHLHVYTLTSPSLTDALAHAAARGVDVQVLITDRPVGQDAWDRHRVAWAASTIQEAGGSVWVAGDDRYRFHHLKVLVADDDVAVQSENWVPTGVPVDPSFGNRGWGVVLHGVGDDIVPLLAADRHAWDTQPFDLAAFDPSYEPPLQQGIPRGTHRAMFQPVTVPGPIEVQWVIGPEHTAQPGDDPVHALIDGASQRLWVQMLDVTTWEGSDHGWFAPDRWHASYGEAGDRGVHVRVLAAAPFRADDTGNAEALAALPPTVARCQAIEGPVVHNKGIVADDAVLVGSMNGNHHSRSMNRELGVIVHSSEVADAFARVHAHDWEACTSDRDIPAPVPTLLLLGLVFASWRCCPRFPSSH